MENENEAKMLADKMSSLAVGLEQSSSPNNNNNNESLFQVMKAVEAAETTIKQQIEENTHLRNELQKHIQELERFKLNEAVGQRHNSDGIPLEQYHKTYESKSQSPVPSASSDKNNNRNMGNTNPSGKPVLHISQKLDAEGAQEPSHAESHTGGSKTNGTLKDIHGSQVVSNNAGMSQISSPSTHSVSPRMYYAEDHDRRLNMSENGLMQMAETNNSNDLWKQDLICKVHQYEEEIKQLRKHLAEYSIKEAQIRNEKYVLEKRIAYMRLALDQQQQDLIEATSKSLSYRQDIIEENIRLTYALQAAQEERTTFASSLLPLLSEYSLQPSSTDAQSIVTNVKVLFKHLQEKLIITESKLKEAQYQLTPWHMDANRSNVAPHSPSHSIGAALETSNKNGLELVPQPTFPLGRMPLSSEAASDRDRSSHHGVEVGKNREPDDLGRFSPLLSRNPAAHDASVPLAVTHAGQYAAQYSEEPVNKQVTFREAVNRTEMDDADAYGRHSEQEPHTNLVPGSSPSSIMLQDPISHSPYLPPVPEDPSSSYSEAADDDPLPGIDSLQISGEALPGWELQACGYSINGTTSCNFEWVRHLQDGSVNYIEGAKQPNYLVTADDVDTYLAIEVQPLDSRKRKGELVKVFANEQRKITCNSEMQSYIEKNFNNGHISYKVSVSIGYLDIWESATLAIKKEGYSIKCNGSSGIVVSEKFTGKTSVSIPYGNRTDFIIIDSDGVEHLLRADDDSDISCWRDTIVLTLRLFIMKAKEKRKPKKKSIFFHK